MILRKIMLASFFVLLIIIGGVFWFLQLPMMGKAASGKRLERVMKSPNYQDGAFRNLNPTPQLAEGEGFFKIMKKYFFEKRVNVKPKDPIPTIKTDLKNLNAAEDILVWFGHSSYFLQIGGRKILVDPVLSKSASPLPNSVKAFDGTCIYSPDDMPEIDYLVITHDHWDHLDYNTVKRLIPKVNRVMCSLGVGEHLEYWGYSPERIIEKDWNESVTTEPGITFHYVPARHFSGRLFKRNQSLWTAYVLETPSIKIFLGGDSGYDDHFAKIGDKFGPFDLAILENGQYNPSWRYIHSLPEQLIPEAKELRAKRVLTVHSSKFALSMHPWKEPLELASANAEKSGVNLITPKIGEIVYLSNPDQKFSKWWEGVE